MKAKDLGLIGLAAVAAYYVYKTYILGAGLTFVPLGVDIGTGKVNIGVQNPTNTPLTLLSFVGTLYNGNTNIANVSNFQGLTVAANSQTNLQFTVTPNLLGLASNIIDQSNNGVNIAIRLQGVANVGGTSIPVNISF